MSAALVIITLLAAGPFLRRYVRSRRTSVALADARARGLPAAVVLLQIAVAAGQSPRAAIATLGRQRVIPGELGVVANDFAAVAQRLDLGADLSDAILGLDWSSGSDEMTRVLDVLRRAEVDGASLGMHLELLVHDLRRLRSLALDMAAQRLTISLLFPLVLCVLPAFILLAVIPLLLGALAGLPA